MTAPTPFEPSSRSNPSSDIADVLAALAQLRRAVETCRKKHGRDVVRGLPWGTMLDALESGRSELHPDDVALSRGGPAVSPEVLFFGVWPGSDDAPVLHDPGGRCLPDLAQHLAAHLREQRAGAGGLHPWTTVREQVGFHGPRVAGRAWHWTGPDHHGHPMTLLTMWDPGDAAPSDRPDNRWSTRCAAFVVRPAVSPALAMRLARAAFPTVWARMETDLGRPAVLAGELFRR